MIKKAINTNYIKQITITIRLYILAIKCRAGSGFAEGLDKYLFILSTKNVIYVQDSMFVLFCPSNNSCYIITTLYFIVAAHKVYIFYLRPTFMTLWS